MSLLSPLSNKKTNTSRIGCRDRGLVSGFAFPDSGKRRRHDAISSTQTKGKGITQGQEEQSTAKVRRFPNLDIRTTEPDTMSEHCCRQRQQHHSTITNSQNCS